MVTSTSIHVFACMVPVTTEYSDAFLSSLSILPVFSGFVAPVSTYILYVNVEPFVKGLPNKICKYGQFDVIPVPFNP